MSSLGRKQKQPRHQEGPVLLLLLAGAAVTPLESEPLRKKFKSGREGLSI